MRILLFVFISIFLLLPDVNAQLLNVERIRMDPDTTGWNGDISVDLSLNRLNDRVIRLNNTSNTSYQTEQHIYLLLTSLELVSIDGNSLVSSGYVHLRSQFLRKKTFSPELFFQHQYNENLGLKNRTLIGSGVRYSFLDRSRIVGNLFTGVMFEHEKWGLRTDEEVLRNLLKSTSTVSVTGQITPETRLLLIGYYQIRPEYPLEPRATLESELLIRISRLFSLSVNYTMTYDTDPVIDIRGLTYELTNGLLIHF